MNRIDELIAQHCPDGVPYVPIADLFDLKNGYTPSKSNASFWSGGDIPWFRMEDLRENGTILDTALQSIPHEAVKGGRLFPANSLLVATSATIGEHALVTVPHLSNQRFTSLALKTEYLEALEMKFVYYYGFVLDEWCRNNTTTSSFASVDMAGFRRFKFPVPPLEVQRAIVEVLDTFSKLEAELEAELEARKQQYEHYHHSLVSKTRFDLDEWVKLSDIATIRTGSKPSIIASDGLFPYINAGNESSGFTDDANTTGDVVTIPSRGQGGAGHVGYQSMDFWCGPLCYRIESKMSNVLNRFLYYFLKNIQDEIVALRKVGSIPAVNKSDLGRIMIPLANVGEQKRIVSILNRFDALVNDLNVGLPAELATRRQQYEYYRGRLLTFREIG